MVRSVRRLAVLALLGAVASSAIGPVTGASAATGDIATFAGGGSQGSWGDGGAATSAALTYPTGIGGYNGSAYIADYPAAKIRRVNASNVISTFAGTGGAGFSGNGGAATSAQLNNPATIDFDSAGNAYIADSANARVRKVTPGGTISTFAGTGTAGYSGDGGAATLAHLYTPTGIEVDSAGNVYIADMGNHTVRKVAAVGGTISTVAGTGVAGYNGDNIAATSARLYTPTSVAMDRGGNLFIADELNHRIRKVSTGGTITTYAGTGSAGYSGNGGAATSAQLNGPSAVEVDSVGTVFLSDEVNNRIRKVSTGGTISLVAGSSSFGGFSGDGGPATSATLSSPYGMFVEADGDLLLADGDNYRVRRVTRAAAPEAPTLTATTPSGPANDNSVQVTGTTQSGFTINLYSSPSCGGTALATGSSATFASPGITVNVADNSTTTFYAKATDSFGNVSGCSRNSVTYVEDSAGPAATIGTSPTTPGSGRSPSWSFSAEAGATFQCELARGATIISAFAACSSPKSFDLTGQADGTYTFSVKATDTVGNVGTTSTSDYVLDTTAPAAPTLTPGQGATGSGRSPSWSLSGEAAATFECRLDRGATNIAAWGACTSPKTYDLTGQADGTYTLSARARDTAGNTGAVSTATYVLDTVAPAAPTVGTPPTSPGNSRSPSWSFSGEAGASFECQLTSGATTVSAWASCSSPKSYDLTGQPDATYTLAVRAKDAANNTGTSTTSNYVLDTSAPAAPAITAAPATPGPADAPSWSWSGESGATFECKLERGATLISDWSTCSGSRSYPLAGEVDGTYTFSVRARDTAGNTGTATPSDFTLDRAAPSVPVIGARPTTPDNDPTPEWTFSGDGGSTFECRIERPGTVVSDWGACTSPADYDLLAQADATYTFSVRGKDAAGNRSTAATDAFVLDRSVPAPPSIDTNPGALGSDTTPSWAFSSEAGATFECRLEHTGGVTVSDWSSCASPRTYDVSGEGEDDYTFRVRATDTAGNTGNESTHTYTLDSSLPSAPNILTSPATPSTGRNPQWTFEGAVGETFDCRVERDGALVSDWASCSSPQAYNLTNEADGTYKFLVRAEDALSRIGAPATSNYVLDTTKPAVPAIGGNPSSPGNDDTPAWAFSAEAGAAFTCRVMRGATEVIPSASCTSAQSFDLTSPKPDGGYTLEVVATDAAGNSSDPAVSSVYTLDRAAPAQPTVDTAPTTPGTSRNPSWTFSGEAGASFECRLDRGPTAIASWSSCSASRAYDLATLTDGTYTFSVRARDAAGNTGSPRTSDYVLDTTAPAAPSVTSQPTTPSNQRAISWSFTGEGGATFECRLERGGAAVQDWTSCAGTKNYDLTGQPDGNYSFLVRATDAAQNTGVPAASPYALDTAPPGDPSIDSQPVSPASDADVTWGFSGDADTASFDCRLRRGGTTVSGWTACTSPRAYALGSEVDGDYTFEVLAHDSIGNPSGTASDVYTLDRSAPAAPSLDSVPSTPSASPTPSWSFSGEANAAFECRLTRGATVVSNWSSCSGSRAYNLTDEPDGSYGFGVRARDEAGNTGAAATSSFVLDRSVPALPTIDGAPGVTGSSHSATWSFSSDPGSTFECRLVRGSTTVSDWGSCSSPKNYDLSSDPDGAYTFHVRARNALGTPSADRTDVYTLDTTAPSAPPIDTNPGARGSSRAPAWSFHGEAGASFECRLETGTGAAVEDWSTCSSPKSSDLGGQADGSYVFKVRAHDQAGNSSSPSSHTYELDTSAPAAPDLTTAPSSPGTSRTPVWKWTGESGASFQCQLARGSDVVADWTACVSGQPWDLSGRSDGTYTLSVRALDAAGNSGTVRTSAYELDTTPGALQILSGPAPIAGDRHPSWSFSGEAGAAFSCRLQQGSDVVADWSGCAAPHSYDLGGRPDGDYLFTVRAADAAGNLSPGIGWPFRLDTIAPAKPSVDARPPQRDRDRTPEWTFSTEPGASFECRVEHGDQLVYDWKPCESPLKVDLRGQDDGVYTLGARAVDTAGNIGETVVTGYRLDTTDPDAPDITTKPGRSGDDRKPKWGWKGESSATFACRLRRSGDTIKDWKACTTPQAYDLGDEKAGTYTFSVRATDAAGNTGAAATDDYELKVASTSSSGGGDSGSGSGDGGSGGGSPGGSGAGAPGAAPAAPAAAPTPAAPAPGAPSADDPADGNSDDSGDDDGGGSKGGGAAGGRGAGPGKTGPGGAAAGGKGASGAADGQNGGDGGDGGADKKHEPNKKFAEDPLGAAAESVTKVAAAIAEEPEKTAFPMGLIFVIAGFMSLQGRIDRNDPKLALAPVFADPDLEFRPPSDALAAVEE